MCKTLPPIALPSYSCIHAINAKISDLHYLNKSVIGKQFYCTLNSPCTHLYFFIATEPFQLRGSKRLATPLLKPLGHEVDDNANLERQWPLVSEDKVDRG